MQRNYNSLKRAAPGTTPSVPQNPASYPVQDAQPLQNQTDPQYYDWNQADFKPTSDLNGYDVTDFASNAYAPELVGNSQVPTQPNLASGTGELVRRNANQQLARQSRNGWEASPGENNPGWVYDDDEDLSRKALEAKREAQTKKRQIPPFVLKLSSFLDESRNTELIRWSDDGKSFIVLDEEEFAKTLIPELFKHNNYASFVRQLNMYGFHKQVGLSDNSMKASENKRKTPSRYANPYFRRGRPELLWLVQKPKAAPTGKRGSDVKGEPDEETYDATWRSGSSPDGENTGSKDLVTITKNDWDQIRQDVVGLKKQNHMISQVLAGMRRQNQDAQQRIQQMHERHENSINAIMTFLATFYNRSLEGQNTANLAEMFAAGLGQGHHQSGNIVDMSDMPDMPEMQFNMQNRNPRPRRPLALLPAPETTITSLPSTASNTPTPRMQNIRRPATTSSPPVSRFEQMDSPNNVNDVPDIMSLINAANASSPANTSGSNFDFSSALEHMETADGNTPLSLQEKSQLLQRMSNEATGSVNSATPINNAVEQQLATTTKTPQVPGPSVNQPNFDLPAPNIDGLLNTAPSIDEIQRLQEEQAKKLQNFAERLGPLSPNGAIPGLHDDSVLAQPNEWDLGDWLANDSYFPDPTTEAFPMDQDGTLFTNDNTNFNLSDPIPNIIDQNKVQSISSRGATPETVATIEDGDISGYTNSPRKRRRQN